MNQLQSSTENRSLYNRTYKDAISEYKQEYLQQGFDQGFVMGIERGIEMGKLLATEVLYLHFGNSNSENHTSKLISLIQLDEAYLKSEISDIPSLDSQRNELMRN